MTDAPRPSSSDGFFLKTLNGVVYSLRYDQLSPDDDVSKARDLAAAILMTVPAKVKLMAMMTELMDGSPIIDYTRNRVNTIFIMLRLPSKQFMDENREEIS